MRRISHVVLGVVGLAGGILRVAILPGVDNPPHRTTLTSDPSASPCQGTPVNSDADLTFQQSADVRVIKLHGTLIDRLCVEKISDRIMEEITGLAVPKVVICFDQIKEVSSAILGAILKIDKNVRLKNGHLRLAGMQPNVHEVFRITRLDTILDIQDSTDEAVRTFP